LGEPLRRNVIRKVEETRMSIPENIATTGLKAPRQKSRTLWVIVIAFFGFGAVAGEILRHVVDSQTLAAEITVFSALILLFLAVRHFDEVDITYVTELITASGLYLTQLLLSTLMTKSLAIGLAVFLFTIARDLIQNNSNDDRTIDRLGARIGLSPNMLFRNLLLGGLACVISELVLRLWVIWQSR
jgi:hypothetical protein